MQNKKLTHTFVSRIWLWPGENAAWHFMTVPNEVSEKIKKVTVEKSNRRGFGSVKVSVTIGKTTWHTSIFPDSRSGCYLLPIKLSVRKTEGLYMDGTAKVKMVLV
jgi:Domain of unknown function (DUF1905)